jgi:WD40 repeat protein
MHPDGKEIASQCGKYVKFFSLATKQETGKILLDAGEYFRYHPDGNSLFVTLGKKVPFPTDRPADVLYLYDKKAGKVTQTFQIPGKELIDRTITYRSAAISKNGQYIALATQPDKIYGYPQPVEYTLQVYVFDTIQGTTYKTITLKHKTTGGTYASDLIRSMTFANNNKTLILGVNEDGGIQFWDLPSISKKFTLLAPKTPTIIFPNPIKLLLSPSETTLYVVEERGQIRRYDIPSKTLTKKYFIMPEDTCYKRPAPCEHRGLGSTGYPHAASLAWSPDGQWLAFHYGYWAGLNIFDYSTMSLYHTQQEDQKPSKRGEYEAKVRTQSKVLWTKDNKSLFVASRKYQKNANIWRYQCK